MSDEHFKKLAGLVAGLSGAAENQTAQLAVLVCAVGALVQTHPNPEAFAAVFRQCWLHLGEPNQAQPSGSQALDGIESVLSILEQMCMVPLGIRPPDVAERAGGLGAV